MDCRFYELDDSNAWIPDGHNGSPIGYTLAMALGHRCRCEAWIGSSDPTAGDPVFCAVLRGLQGLQGPSFREMQLDWWMDRWMGCFCSFKSCTAMHFICQNSELRCKQVECASCLTTRPGPRKPAICSSMMQHVSIIFLCFL